MEEFIVPGGEEVLSKQAVASKPRASSSSHAASSRPVVPTLLMLKTNNIHATNPFIYLCS